MGDTKTELVRDLEALPQSAARDRLIERARAGVFHDFEAEVAFPKMMLVTELVGAGYAELATKVVRGDYDDERPADDKAQKRGQ